MGITLTLGPGLQLDKSTATARIAILAASGAGKSNTAVVMAEEMFDAGIPWVAIDPKGDWYGIRAAGKHKGLPIPVIGGLHGDVPLDFTAGKVIADMVASERMTCVIDVSEAPSRAAMFRFLHDFAEQLLKVNKLPLHVFCEEADDYLPQKVTTGAKDLAACLGSWQRLVKRGRFRGIGSTIITQRSAAVNKDVLYMAEILFAMRTMAPGDRKVIGSWVDYMGLADEFSSTLPTLEDGEAWMISPQFLKTTRRVKMRRRRTFDSGATPEVGAEAVDRKFAAVNLDALRTRLEKSIEAAAADDPKVLKARIAELEKNAAPKVCARCAELQTKNEFLRTENTDLHQRLDQIRALAGPPTGEPVPTPVASMAAIQEAAKAAGRVNRPPQPSNPKDGEGLTGPQRKVLDALAWWETIGVSQPAKLQVAFVAGYKPSGGGFNNLLSSLRTAGWIDYPAGGQVSLTDEGRSKATAPAAPPDRATFLALIASKLTAPQMKVLQPLLDFYPNPLSNDALAGQSGYSAGGGGFNNLRSQLSSLGLIEYPGKNLNMASDLLFPRGL